MKRVAEGWRVAVTRIRLKAKPARSCPAIRGRLAGQDHAKRACIAFCPVKQVVALPAHCLAAESRERGGEFQRPFSRCVEGDEVCFGTQLSTLWIKGGFIGSDRLSHSNSNTNINSKEKVLRSEFSTGRSPEGAGRVPIRVRIETVGGGFYF